MNEEYYKTLKFYVDSLSIKGEIDINSIRKLILGCPVEFKEIYENKNILKKKNYITYNSRSFTTCSLGVCYLLAKTNFTNSDILIKPLVNILNYKLNVSKMYGNLIKGDRIEKIVIEKTQWSNFIIILSTLCSYVNIIGTKHIDYDNIVKCIISFWIKLVRIVFNLSNIQNIYFEELSSDKESKLSSINYQLKIWYVCALCYSSIGLLLALNCEDLSDLIINCDKFYDFLPKSLTLNFEIPEIIYKLINELMKTDFIDLLTSITYNISTNPLKSPERLSIKTIFTSAISVLINRTTLSPSSSMVVTASSTTHDLSGTYSTIKIGNIKRLIHINQTNLTNKDISYLSNIKCLKIIDLINFENLHVGKDLKIYYMSLTDAYLRMIDTTDENNFSGIENILDNLVKLLTNKFEMKWPISIIHIHNRISGIVGICELIKKYPQYIEKLRILNTLLDIFEQNNDIFIINGSQIYPSIIKSITSTLCIFSHKFIIDEMTLCEISGFTAYYLYFNQKLLHLFLECICMILEKNEDHTESIYQTISCFSHSLYDFNRNAINDQHNFTNINSSSATIKAIISAHALAYIGSKFSYLLNVFNNILLALNQSFMNPVSIIDYYIVNEMIYVMLSKQNTASYSSVIDTLKKLIISTTHNYCSENINSENIYRYACSAFVSNFRLIGENLKPFSLRFRFMEDLLDIYILLSNDYRKSNNLVIKLTYLSIFIGHTIKALADVMSKIGQIVNITPRIQQLFKNFWVCLVVMGSSNVNIDNLSILEEYKRISTFSPPLVVDHLRSDLQYNIVIDDNWLDNNDLNIIKNLLIECLECSLQVDICSIINRLPALHLIYITAIYEQESLAVEYDTSRFPHLFIYLEDSALEKDKQNIGTLVEYTCDKIFTKFIIKLTCRKSGYILDNDLVKHINILLINFNSERKRVQRAADKYLSEFFNKFPHMLWNSVVVRSMLDFMHILKVTCNDLQTSCISTIIDVPHTKLKYTLPDTKAKRDEILYDYYCRCESLINEAVRCAPACICSILLEYLSENKLTFKHITHYGIELLMTSIVSSDIDQNKIKIDDDINNTANITNNNNNIINSNIPTTSSSVSKGDSEKKRKLRQTANIHTILSSNKDKYLNKKGFVSNCTYTATNRSHYLGKIDGLLQNQNSLVHQGNKYYPDFEKKLIDKFNEKINMNTWELSDFIMLATSYICITKRFVRKIIFQICNFPLINFTPDSIYLAIESWEWIFTSCKTQQVPLLSVILSSWESTINKKLGIFDINPTIKYGFIYSDYPSYVHYIWIEFLINRFEIIKFYDTIQIRIITQILDSTIRFILSSNISKHYFEINSIPILKIIIFGFKLLQNRFISTSIIKDELRIRIFQLIMLYFGSDFLWSPHSQTTQLLIHLIITIIKLLHNDKKFTPSNTNDKTDNASAGSVETKKSTFTALLSTDTKTSDHSKTYFSSGTLFLRRSKNNISKIDHLTNYDTISGANLDNSQFYVNLSENRSFSSMGKSTFSDLDISLLRNTLIQLFTRELERLVVWQNPIDRNDTLYLESIKNVKSTFFDKNYRSKINVLWNINPIVTINLVKRFLELPIMSKDISNLIRNYPYQVIGESSAVNMFWLSCQESLHTPNYIKSLLLIWKRCPIGVALEFLTPHLNNINIISTQFAISSFKCSPLDQVIFYIPQLVQILRHDTWSYLEQYFLWISQRSCLISHQFIWNMQTNAYIDENSTILDPQIGKKLLEIIEKIQHNFNDKALQFYEREFTFFHNITKISAILKPYEKSQRRKICQEELAKIQTEFGVYLPTNPDSIILNIDYNSGIPMQSAAKAPFLARFEVLISDTESVEKINTSSTTQDIVKNENVTMKGAIFKVGDDVRQDMLALQIISLFKNIFKNYDLRLYLYPYRVVATLPGCGVIECVANAKSRDQLGKHTDASLHQYFTQTFGSEHTYAYKKARENFTNSLAAYSVVSYILQVKDRHNGNIMINNEGCIIHIDFGFLFESSPGGNIGFEPDMKITAEMLNILGGSTDSIYFKSFIQNCIKGYLVVRQYHQQVINIVAHMLDSNLPCFRGETLKRLRNRFALHLSEKEAAQFFEKIINDSCLNLRTLFYDWLQKTQNEIPY